MVSDGNPSCQHYQHFHLEVIQPKLSKTKWPLSVLSSVDPLTCGYSRWAQRQGAQVGAPQCSSKRSEALLPLFYTSPPPRTIFGTEACVRFSVGSVSLSLAALMLIKLHY